MNHPKLVINPQKRKIDETCLKSERGVVSSSGIWPAKVGIHIFSDRKGEICQIRIGISTRSRMGNAMKFTNHVRYRITSITTYGGKFKWGSLSGPPNIWIPRMTNGYISAGVNIAHAVVMLLTFAILRCKIPSKSLKFPKIPSFNSGIQWIQDIVDHLMGPEPLTRDQLYFAGPQSCPSWPEMGTTRLRLPIWSLCFNGHAECIKMFKLV